MWIRIEMAHPDPDPGQSKWRLKRGKIQRFQLEKSIDLLKKAWWFLLEPGSP